MVNAPTDVNKMAATVLGGVFVLVGILGFVMDPILGYFETSLIHNLVHLLSGVGLLALAFTGAGRRARLGLLAVGGVYGFVALLGFVLPGLLNILLGGVPGTPALNDRDNFLHLFLAVVLLAVPLVFKQDAPGADAPARV